MNILRSHNKPKLKRIQNKFYTPPNRERDTETDIIKEYIKLQRENTNDRNSGTK